MRMTLVLFGSGRVRIGYEPLESLLNLFISQKGLVLLECRLFAVLEYCLVSSCTKISCAEKGEGIAGLPKPALVRFGNALAGIHRSVSVSFS